MKKVLKVVAIIVGIILFLFFGLLTFNYLYNEFTISKYEEHEYSHDVDLLTHTSIFQSYIAHYNNGNIHYKKGEYEEAIEDYKQALAANPSHESDECDIRVNLALAIIGTLPENYSAPENIEQSIATLEEARDYLLEEECAMNDVDGHDEDAQKLKEEIDALIEQLKQQQNQGGSGNNNQQQPEEPEEEQDDGQGDDEEQQIKEELQQLQQNAHEEREDTLQLYEEMDSNADYNYGGTIW
ncbi:MAG: tetratricopeptide repeat protein [Lachnospiraceae bacterium]|nr:tetratricopeptide repeat protein [Lachnospiraceae bacterium]